MSKLATHDPSFGHLARQMGKMAEQLHRGYYSFYPSETWTPAVNLYETETAYLVCVDLAGVERDKIELTVDHNRLKLRGTRTVPSNADSPEANLRGRRVRLHLMEIDHGAFCREVELPDDVRHGQINASYRDGLLWVEIPKK
jgi:HSP20 family protein